MGIADHSLRPFRLEPIAVERPWGGRRLARYGTSLPADTTIGESWQVVDFPDEVTPGVPDPRSRIATGPLTGRTISDLMASHRPTLLGSQFADLDRFPLLVKLLDAREHLSVQVHPDAEYVRSHPEARLKTESWFVMSAEPGAELMMDVLDGVTIADIDRCFGSSDFVDLLRRVPARVGDFHHIPAGLIHSLGAGVVVAEVQTPSDSTFRLYDWSEEYGRIPRALHRDEALASIRIQPEDAFSVSAIDRTGADAIELVSNSYYRIVEHRVDDGLVTLSDRPGPLVILVVGGVFVLDGLVLSLGDTVIVPAGWERVQAHATDAIVLEVGVG